MDMVNISNGIWNMIFLGFVSKNTSLMYFIEALPYGGQVGTRDEEDFKLQ